MYKLTKKQLEELKKITIDLVNFEDFEKVICVKQVSFNVDENHYNYDNKEHELYLLCNCSVLENYKLLIVSKIEMGIHNIDCLISYKVNKPVDYQTN